MKKSYQTKTNLKYISERKKHLKKYFALSDLGQIVDTFPKYVKRQEMTRLIARFYLFEKIKNIQGSIIECGVYNGNGIFSWAHLSSIIEPVGGFFREIYGFDTFEGFPSVHSKDKKKIKWISGDLKSASKFKEIQETIKLFDKNRFLSQKSKIKLIKGDFNKTAEKFIKDNPHLLVSLLFLDFDIYEPTRKALEIFLPRMPKGSIIVFDQINHEMWPGETMALLEQMNIKNYKIEKFNFEINMSYIVL